jgi:hypothetical protein
MSKHRRPGDRRPGLVLAALAVAGVTLLGASSPALAAKGGKGGAVGGSAESSISLVLRDSADDLPNWGEHVSFLVSTSATSRPYVTLTCSQGGSQVSTMTAGFFPDYVWGQDFALSSSAWKGGPADCLADLHYTSANGRSVHLASLGFSVAA